MINFKFNELNVQPSQELTEIIGDTLLLVDVRPKYIYVDRQKTELIEGYLYEIVLPERAYEKVEVLISEKDQSFKPNEEELKKGIPVKFDNLIPEVGIKYNNNFTTYYLKLTADNVRENRNEPAKSNN